ncbi:hypothetical protein [Parendozoicomonas sp. Alg238-R29]|uniref:hypothetical protein n=1 Tax=Parendozoicomonas sp. Alg238-R29 TaxID=2993446 RepID=UPI00248D5066|nr:hypothetical protein [Parendozoicomonas sp. Alg238-R29]
MMRLVDQASNDRNHKVILSYLTDDAVIISDLPNKIGETLTMTKEEYKQGLLAAWSLPMQMTYYTRGLKVKLSADKQSAITTQTVLETVVHNGRLLASASTKETSEVVLVNGKPKVRRIEGIVSVK